MTPLPGLLFTLMLAILSDIHSNLHALEAVLEECRGLGVTEYCCLGDIVGYGAYPAECVERIRALGCPVVQGNHDAYASSGQLDDDVSPLAKAGLEYSVQHLSQEDLGWLASLPAVQKLSPLITLVHSSLHEPGEWHYVRISRLAEDSFEHQDSPVCFFGHTHFPQIFECRPYHRPEALEPRSLHLEERSRYLINPGSVGQPRNGAAQAQFALFDSASRELQLRRVPYDVESAVQAIFDAGLPDALGERLREGF